MAVDLHVHTSASDGILSPYKVVKLASELNLKIISITDHDTVGGIEESLEASVSYGIKVIPGIEISCELDEEEVHILGYLINYKDPNFLEFLKKMQNERRQRVEKILNKLEQSGFIVSQKSVFKLSNNSSSVGRPHIAQALVNSGYAADSQQAFDKLIGKNCLGYVPRNKLSTSDAIKLIINAGGVPVLAHPSFMPGIDKVNKIIKQGIRGLEVFYPDHKWESINKLLDIAKKYNLIITGGSDFHGDNRGGAKLGECFVTENVVRKLLKIEKYNEQKI